MKHFDEHTYMLQSYYVITNQVGYEQLLNRDMKVTLIFDPTRDVIEDYEEVFDQLIEYFEDLEDYEKCANKWLTYYVELLNYFHRHNMS